MRNKINNVPENQILDKLDTNENSERQQSKIFDTPQKLTPRATGNLEEATVQLDSISRNHSGYNISVAENNFTSLPKITETVKVEDHQTSLPSPTQDIFQVANHIIPSLDIESPSSTENTASKVVAEEINLEKGNQRNYDAAFAGSRWSSARFDH